MTAPVVTRAQCGLRPPTAALPTNITPQGTTAHYGGTAIGGFPWTHDRCAAIWRAYQAYHQDHNGWLDIAYSYGACIHGYLFEGRGWGHRTAANGSDPGNQNSYAICYMAGDGEPFTDEAKVAFLDGFDMARRDGGAGTALWQHNHWFKTSCPGSFVGPWMSLGCPRPGSVVSPPNTQPVQPHVPLSAPAVAMVPTRSGRGYIIIAADGGVFNYGDAAFHGSLPGLNAKPNQPVVGGDISPSGGGYWLVGADGGVYAFGDAPFKGSLGGITLNAPIRGLRGTPDGAGYWLVGADGGVFAYGDAVFAGSPA